MVYEIIYLTLTLLHPTDRSCTYENYFYYSQSATVELFQNNNLQKAKNDFKKAFNEDVFPLGIDVANAPDIAARLNDKEWGIEHYSQLVKSGIPIEYFHSS